MPTTAVNLQGSMNIILLVCLVLALCSFFYGAKVLMRMKPGIKKEDTDKEQKDGKK